MWRRPIEGVGKRAGYMEDSPIATDKGRPINYIDKVTKLLRGI